ncbi:MAG: methicillin resistance protein, partial [Lachnospiraceae bacterium]|nr:methicillin resistance protein [Lachnospiraceae bacterium]
SVEPENNEIQIGIIQPDGIIRYIDGLDNIFHDFVIKQDGEYRIYVYNSSDNLVSISISYMH